ncbi:PepSY-associated TM helix domain-containing protein [Agarivorans sp. QJM3NY_25]|uniref:PepSY-associated TM helix domain-containing protein n=1 Tax=Agarivorans sp. QJM3NY_25 TaxID=3421430 RepID=UPI003D7C7BF4
MLRSTSTERTNTEKQTATKTKRYYMIAWRWHFYAGLFVVPFLLMLSITGLVMLYDDAIEQAQFADIIQVKPYPTTVSPAAQLAAVQASYPQATIQQYITPASATQASRFAVKAAGESLFITVDPYTGKVLGQINRDQSWYNLANSIHGSLLLGDIGDRLIEMAASLSIVLLITGIYLWWPRDKISKSGLFKIRFNNSTRIMWRDLHANVGLVTSVFLLLFLISGLSWTGIWGAKYVQAWNSFPAQKWDAVPLSTLKHASMNHSQTKEVPWNLEQTRLPSSDDTGQPAKQHTNLNSIVNFAQQHGFTRFRINLPNSATAVYTVSANTMSGDISDATQDRTAHLDQYSGQLLAEAAWSDYSLMAKFMAVGIALHQGEMGWLNVLIDTLLCAAFILIAISGVVMWWLRRPKGVLKLAAPPLPTNMPLWKSAALVMFAVSLMFPMAGLCLLSILLLDFVILSRIPRLKSFIS